MVKTGRPVWLLNFGAPNEFDVLGGVIKLVLDQRHELGITTLGAVMGIERDDEIRH